MDKTKQLVIAMILGFGKDHDIFEGVEWSGDMADALLGEIEISKDDIFSKTENNKSFFQYKETWVNLDKIFRLIGKNGETITVDDLKKIITDYKSAIDMAADCQELDKVFNPDLWVGRREEMESLWFALPQHKKSDFDFDKVRDVVAAKEGKPLRETRLKEMGISVEEMRNAIKDGKIDAVVKKLEERGDHITLEDLKLCDEAGNHPLDIYASWSNFERLYDELEKHGEIPDADFFLFRRGTRNSIIEKAFLHADGHEKVFSARVFAGRPEEALKLYNSLKADHKEKIKIGNLIAEIVENECANMITIDQDLTLERLTEALYGYNDGESGAKRQVIALGLKKVWENIDDVLAILKGKGETISLSMLQQPCGLGADTCLHRAARFDRFDAVMALAAENGDKLTLEALLTKGRDDQSVLDILVQEESLDALLQPALWVRRVDDLAMLWENLPASARADKKEAFLETQTKANQLSLRVLGDRMNTPPPAPAPAVVL